MVTRVLMNAIQGTSWSAFMFSNMLDMEQKACVYTGETCCEYTN